MCVSGLVGGKNVSHAQRQDALFDLPGYLKRRLERQGLLQVVDTGLCTYRDEARFFSYRRATHRRESLYGRQISAIALKD